ncbi:NUDIX hydrolase [Methylobacterium sp. C25]|uniref:NUDIX hydrolase n=1 Tax=Methylobacterium sp. C25 TaxID=2721622 RepID=UPI001F380C40|nr:NUDIX hydrolase [Methylobacterium sp. C25]MCE4223644.1 NUDIX hydrolase [Methylobacterium sp. C25]
MSEGSGHGFTLVRLASVSARLDEYDWAWARENAEAIDDNWQRRVAERPGMFDGPVLLSQGCTIANRACEVRFFETRYSRFIASRDWKAPKTGVYNAFSAIVPHTSDGAVLLGEMGAHTANAGQVYFPCGTPDREDVRDGGLVDLPDSAAREFEEETGLVLPKEARRAPWVLLRGDGQLAFLRPVTFAESAEELVAQAEAHHARDEEPELARMVIARSPADIDPARMPGYVRTYLDAVFA